MSNWAEDPQLYLYTEGDNVYLWRCNKTKNSMPMEDEDFDELSKVTNHLDLVGLGNTSIINWDRDNYIKLVKYISSMRLLVNSHGLVIAEHNKYTEDGKIDDTQSPVYIRALDVLPLERFNLRERPIPPRTARYFEGDGTRDAPVVKQDLSNVAEKKLVTYLEGIVNTEKKLEGIVTKLTGDLAVRMNGLEVSLQELINLVKSTNEVMVLMDTKITDLQVKVETVLVLDWMNDFTDSNWVGIEEVQDITNDMFEVYVIGPRGSYICDDNKSNVRACYFYMVRFLSIDVYKAVAIEDLNLGKEKARFSKHGWWLIKYKGISYVFFSDEL